jgi:4'-phosphopantetheinyl transferase
MLECRWRDPPIDLALTSDEVHVWQASLEQPAERVRQLSGVLAEDERRRADHLHRERDRRRFIAGRGILRAILGRYLATEPCQVVLSYGPQGKPFLMQRDRDDDLRFNVAHSQDLALYAFALGRGIGVDLERIHPMSDADQLAASFFSLGENSAYQSLPSDEREEAFFRCWTRKEAYLKALGEGLTRPLGGFDVSLLPGEPAQLLRVKGHPGETDRWSLKTLRPASGFMAALAVEGRGWRLLRWYYE